MGERGNPLSGRLIIGLVLVALGVLWTLDNLGLTDAAAIVRWWPVVLLAVGLMKLTGFGMDKQTGLGAFLTAAGGLLLLGEMDVVHVDFGIIWPLFFIFLGIQITMRAMRGVEGNRAAGGTVDSDDYVRSFAIMGGVERRNESLAFRGGELTAVMGGVQLDLSGARAAGGRAVVDVFTIWGGIEIRVPEDWRVELEATPVMAGVESTARLAPGVEPAGTLVVRGFAMMGGVEIKNGPLGEQRAGVIIRTHREGDRIVRKEVRIGQGGVTVTREAGKPDPPPPTEPQ